MGQISNGPHIQWVTLLMGHTNGSHLERVTALEQRPSPHKRHQKQTWEGGKLVCNLRGDRGYGRITLRGYGRITLSADIKVV